MVVHAATESQATPSDHSTIKTIFWLFVLATCLKVLLIPTYRSTDFDVHRNWLAITRHLPLRDWYYDNVNGTTVHTLDYPPSFAYFEYMLANNPITNALLKQQWLDERCLQLLPDHDNDPSSACVVFHRATVMVSDTVLWWGAWVAATAAVGSTTSTYEVLLGIPWTFWLIVFHPGLIFLDHVHFQYNGMLLGLLLASLGYLMRANNYENKQKNNHDEKNDDTPIHINHWKAAVLFAGLLTMKHLFLTLAPVYFVYLLRRYCLVWNDNQQRLVLQPLRLVTLGGYTATALLLPMIPFVKQLPQVATRLFPFGRGLVHDYWAANVWALYQLADKVCLAAFRSSLPNVPPSVCAGLTLLALVPGLYGGAWKAAVDRSNTRLLQTMVYAALSAFQFGFHVHEKAIMNASVPFCLLLMADSTNVIHDGWSHSFLHLTALGLLGIFPLLFRPVELPLKLVMYTGYMAVCFHVVGAMTMKTSSTRRQRVEWAPLLVLVGAIILILEVIPATGVLGKMEFLPLLLTSVGCALGLTMVWLRLLYYILHDNNAKRSAKTP